MFLFTLEMMKEVKNMVPIDKYLFVYWHTWTTIRFSCLQVKENIMLAKAIAKNIYAKKLG